MALANVVLHQPQAQYLGSRISTRFDAELNKTLWIKMARDPVRQNFSLPLLKGLGELLQEVRDNAVTWNHGGRNMPIKYAVFKSDHPDYFSLGGDLTHFHECIERKNWQGLFSYSKLCLDILYEWATVFGGVATTISLIQGRALGGGFEAALAADFLIAEEHSEFGFPEIMFGLFPCTGAMSLLSRRIGVHAAEKMMTTGKIYTANELMDMGVVDEICEKGAGEDVVEKFIVRHSKHITARLMLQRSRHRLAPLDYQELLTVVDEWVETAKQISAEDLRVMEVLGLMQSGR